MKKIVSVAIMAAALSTIVGCAPKPPSAVAISSANYGTLPIDYKEQIKNYFNKVLKDPYSAQFTFEAPYKGLSQDGALSSTNGGVLYGHVVPVQVNAKNSYGGYTGNQLYVFIFSNGVIYDSTMNYQYGRVMKVD